MPSKRRQQQQAATVIAVVLFVVGCSAPIPQTTTTTTATDSGGDGKFDLPDDAYDPTTTTTLRPAPVFTTTTTTFTPLVASPFTREELAFLNAWAVFKPEPSRYHANGIDTDGDGSVDQGWHNPEWLEPTLNRVFNGHQLCDRQTAEHWLRNTPSIEREWREQFVLVARAWLC